MEIAEQLEELKAALAARDVDLAARDVLIAELQEEVARLRELVGRDSSNSNQPPSSDPPGAKSTKRKKAKGKRRRGGQKGHRGSRRMLLPEEQVDAFVDLFPPECEGVVAEHLKPLELGDVLAPRRQRAGNLVDAPQHGLASALAEGLPPEKRAEAA